MNCLNDLAWRQCQSLCNDREEKVLQLSVCRNILTMFGVVARSNDSDRTSKEDAINAAKERKKAR